MDDSNYHRAVQTSVTNFLYHGDEYLFIKRSADKRIDPGRLNGIGGRVEPGENFLDAAIRETKEETGYQVKASDMSLCGVVRLEGGYKEDWVMVFFKTKVPLKKVPHGIKTDDGTLHWLHKDKVLDSKYELVDDLNYCFKEIVNDDCIFFMNARMDEREKIVSFTMSNLAK